MYMNVYRCTWMWMYMDVDDRRLGRAGYAPVWGLDRDLLKKRHFFAKIVEIAPK